MSHRLVELFLTACAVPVLAMTGYLFALALWSRRPARQQSASGGTRFDIVVPAHDEQDGIGDTVRNLLALDYPAQLRRVLVVADNCSDDTAERAERAGAIVLDRRDPVRRGKGYALARAFAQSLADGFADAVVVIDADTVASPNLLRVFSARLRAGAEAIQAQNAVGNPEASWRTRLMAIAFSLFNTVRSLARERLRVSVGLRGNGMCFSVPLLRRVPHYAHSIVEDIEYGIRLGFEGYRVHYAHDAIVRSDMVTSEKASRSQRKRWEDGRREIRQRYVAPLLKSAILRRDPLLFDLALDLLVPPLAVVAASVAVGVGLTVLGSLRADHVLHATYPWLLSGFFLTVYVLRGVWLAGMGARGIVALLYAPVYVGWKLALPFLGGQERGAWVRTERERPVRERVVRERPVRERSAPAQHDLVSNPVPAVTFEAPPRGR